MDYKISPDFDYTLQKKVYECMANDKKNNGYWSLKEVCLKIDEKYGITAALDARDLIVKYIAGITDEEKYINDCINTARTQKLSRRMTNKNSKTSMFEGL